MSATNVPFARPVAKKTAPRQGPASRGHRSDCVDGAASECTARAADCGSCDAQQKSPGKALFTRRPMTGRRKAFPGLEPSNADLFLCRLDERAAVATHAAFKLRRRSRRLLRGRWRAR